MSEQLLADILLQADNEMLKNTLRAWCDKHKGASDLRILFSAPWNVCHCYQCGEPIFLNDDAEICIQCGGRNVRCSLFFATTGKPPYIVDDEEALGDGTP